MKNKIAILSIIHVILLVILNNGYTEQERFRKIVNSQNPIRVNVVNISYHAKSSTTCDIIYGNKIYKNVDILRNKVIKGENNKDFYLDKEKSVIFYKNNGKSAFKILTILFVLSFFLWLIPSKKFRWE